MFPVHYTARYTASHTINPTISNVSRREIGGEDEEEGKEDWWSNAAQAMLVQLCLIH